LVVKRTSEEVRKQQQQQSKEWRNRVLDGGTFIPNERLM
jgi:hypothetical protein